MYAIDNPTQLIAGSLGEINLLYKESKTTHNNGKSQHMANWTTSFHFSGKLSNTLWGMFSSCYTRRSLLMLMTAQSVRKMLQTHKTKQD